MNITLENELVLVQRLIRSYTRVSRLWFIPFLKSLCNMEAGLCFYMYTLPSRSYDRHILRDATWDNVYRRIYRDHYLLRMEEYKVSALRGTLWFKAGALKPRIKLLKLVEADLIKLINEQ